MKRFGIVCIYFFIAGCTNTEGAPVLGAAAAISKSESTAELSRHTEMTRISGMERRFLSLHQIKEGMTKSEVKNLIGNPVVVGYELRDANSISYRPITIDNPFRKEIFEKDTKKYEIEYYLVGIRKPDDKISDSELIPFVYHKDKLLGTGWIFLNREIKK